MDCGSEKSLNHPTFGQIATLAFGTPQNFVYSVSCGTMRKFSLNPSFSNWFWTTSAGLLARIGVGRDGQDLAAPAYLPLETGTPGLGGLHVLLGHAMSPPGSDEVEVGGRFRPPASSNPGIPGGM